MKKLLLCAMILCSVHSNAMDSEESKVQKEFRCEELYKLKALYRENFDAFTRIQEERNHLKSHPDFHDALANQEVELDQLKENLTQQMASLEKTIEEHRATIFSLVKRKLPEQSEDLKGSDFALTAASQIPDLNTRETIENLCKVFHKDIDLLINWLLLEVSNPKEILDHWKELPLHQRPIIKIPGSWKPEYDFVKVEGLIDGLHNGWQGEPMIVSGEHHVATMVGKRDDEAKTFTVDFYDAYEPFATHGSSYLELTILLDFLHKQFPTYTVNVIPHYTQHQKLTSFGECGLYAYAHYNWLLQGKSPDMVSEDEILSEVNELKRQIRQDDPEYFDSYDVIFQYVFDSGFAEILLKTIWEHHQLTATD